MAATPLAMSALINPINTHTHERDSSIMESRKSIFGSLKHTLSRNKQSASNNVSQSSHPQAKSVSSPTRRPTAPSSNPFHSASSLEAPPAYSAAPNAAPQPRTINGSTPAVADDAYAFLDKFDTVFLIDDSGSMAGGLWRQTADALMTITPICTAHDDDGVDIWFLNHRKEPYKNVTTSAAVSEIFRNVKPGGPTPIGTRLDYIFNEYLDDYQNKSKITKPMNIICITDGVPTDDDEGALTQFAKKLDRLEAPAWQVGVQFFQVGSDPEATRHLKELDDDLADLANDKDMRDIVDTVPFLSENGTTLSGTGILKVVLGAVTRRLDRKSRELHR